MSAQDAGAGAASVTSAQDPAELEALLQRAWADVLGLPAVDPTAHVFDLGVTSLAALQVAERVAREGGLELAVTDLFRFASIRELVRHLTAERSGPARGRGTSRRAPERAPAVAASRPGADSVPATGVDAPVRGYSGDVDELEGVVTGVFREVLADPGAGPDSHFFDTGGDAATAQDACRALQGITGEPLCFMQIARYPTPRELARHLVATAGQPPTCPAQGVMNRLIHRHEWQRG